MGGYFYVTVRELCEPIVMSWGEIWVRSSLWCHCDVKVMVPFEVTVSSYCDLSMRFVWDHCDVMVTSDCWRLWSRQHSANVCDVVNVSFGPMVWNLQVSKTDNDLLIYVSLGLKVWKVQRCKTDSMRWMFHLNWMCEKWKCWKHTIGLLYQYVAISSG